MGLIERDVRVEGSEIIWGYAGCRVQGFGFWTVRGVAFRAEPENPPPAPAPLRIHDLKLFKGGYIGLSAAGLRSEFLKGGYGDYIGEYYMGCQGVYREFRL